MHTHVYETSSKHVRGPRSQLLTQRAYNSQHTYAPTYPAFSPGPGLAFCVYFTRYGWLIDAPAASMGSHCHSTHKVGGCPRVLHCPQLVGEVIPHQASPLIPLRKCDGTSGIQDRLGWASVEVLSLDHYQDPSPRDGLREGQPPHVLLTHHQY